MKRNGNAKRLRAAFATALMAALVALLFAGCKDLFHPEGPEGGDDYYTVTFNAQYGTPSTQTRSVAGGGSVGSNMPGEPGRDRYAFDGWYTSPGSAGSQFTPATTVTGNRTVYAKWAKEPAAPHMYGLTRNHGETWDNYAFVASDFLPEGFAVRAGDWIEISFLIKTDTKLDGFPIGIADRENVSGDSGWIAEGWNSTKSVTADERFHRCAWTLTTQASGPAGAEPLLTLFVTDVLSEQTITIYVGSVTVANVYAHTVTFNADGGSFGGGDGTQTQAIASGYSPGVNMPSAPTKSGYVFGGWYAGRNGGGEEFTSATMVTSDTTVYAKWIKRYTVTFNADGGSFSGGGETQTILIGSGGSPGGEHAFGSN